MAKKIFTVEFFGMPGVGKSILSCKVSERLISNGYSVDQYTYQLSHDKGKFRRIIHKLRHVLKELVFHPCYSWSSIRCIKITQQKTFIDFLKVTFNWLFLSNVLRDTDRNQCIQFLDEGILQALWSVAFSGNEDSLKAMSSLFSMMPLPRMLVVTEADLKTIKNRMNTRDLHDSRLEKQQQKLEEAHVLFNEIKKGLQAFIKQRGVHLVFVNNNRDEDLEINVQKIMDNLERILQT